MPARALSLLALVLLAGCGPGGLATDYELRQRHIAQYLGEHPDLDPQTRAAIASSELRKGMTMHQVVVAWGPPAVVQNFRGGARQYWFFGCSPMHPCMSPEEWFPPPDAIYIDKALFDDGHLVSWSQ